MNVGDIEIQGDQREKIAQILTDSASGRCLPGGVTSRFY